jgi:hypothetical protein
MASRLGLERGRDDRSFSLIIRAGIPDTLRMDRAVAPAVPIPDDRRVGAENTVRE